MAAPEAITPHNPATTARALYYVLAIAFAIRLAVALWFPNVIAFDEIYQYLEPAHRLVFGQGFVPWEFQVGLRSWLIPLLLAGPMAVAHWLFADPLAGLVLIRGLLCLASLSIVWCAARWGERFYGIPGLWIAGLLAAAWPDLWLMAPHSLEEVLAADVLVPALYLIETTTPGHSLHRVGLAGFLLGLACVFRMQLAPAIALAGVVLCGRQPIRWGVALAAAALPVFLAGMLDWYSWGQPFRSFWLNIYINTNLGVTFGGFSPNPFDYYLHMLTLMWLWTLFLMAILIWRGAKLLPLSTAAALIILLSHSLIAHKEYRYIFPAITLLVPIAGVGLAGWLAGLRRSQTALPPRLVLMALLLAGPFCSPWLYYMLTAQVASFSIFEKIKQQSSGLVALNQPDYYFLPLDMLFIHNTLVMPLTLDGMARLQPGAIVSPADGFMPPDHYHLDYCEHQEANPFTLDRKADICVWLNDRLISQPPPAPLVNFYVPDAAKPFIIRDRLTN
ncbi:MAG: mannosyltransferase [Acidocella sp.]|nr:mannosyltransferase [Acidocella sp.]